MSKSHLKGGEKVMTISIKEDGNGDLVISQK